MKAGLLVCDHVYQPYQAEFGDYPDMFQKLFPSFEWEFFDVINGQFPEDLDSCNVYMATGSLHSVYEDILWIHRVKKIIADLYQQQKYFIGFCFGHQLIGEALGGKVEKANQGWCVGTHKIDIIQKEVWMKPDASSVNLLMMCQDQVIGLPPDSTVLGRSEKCPNAIIQVGNTFLGIQAHPEFSKAYDAKLMSTRIDRMGKEVVATAMKSLDEDLDPQLLAKWVINFIISNKLAC